MAIDNLWVQEAASLARSLGNEFLCEQALALNSLAINIFLFMKIQVLGQFQSHTTIVMVTQISTPSGQVRSPTTSTGEESVIPVSQPSGLGELSALMFTEPDRKQEAIQRAQVGSLMGANRNREPQDKTPKKQSPTSATRPKKYAWACTPPLKKTLTVLIFPSPLSTRPTLGVLACT